MTTTLLLDAALALADAAIEAMPNGYDDIADADLADQLDRLRGDDGIIAAFRMLERDLENEIVSRIPLKDGTPQKWTDIPGWRLERNGGGQWRVDARSALIRLFSDAPPEPTALADLVIEHLSAIETAWRTRTLEASLIAQGVEPGEEPVLDGDGEPVRYKSGARAGEPRTRKVSPIVVAELGDRTEGRTTVRLHRSVTP